MDISQNGINLIKSFEGLLLVASNKLDGVWTVGYGCTVGVTPHMKITEKQAEDMLKREVSKHVSYVNKYDKYLKFNQNEFDALVSFSYNCGQGNLKKLLDVDNTGKPRRDKPTIAKKMLLYNKCNGKVMRGLQNRRNKECDLFLSKVLTKDKKSDILNLDNKTLSEICKLVYNDNTFVFRKKLYKKYFGDTKSYLGTYSQNIDLMNKIKSEVKNG